jgi:hypothetical protein
MFKLYKISNSICILMELKEIKIMAIFEDIREY